MKRFSALLALVFAACASMPANDAEDVFRRGAADFAAAANAGNVDRIVSYYADDAVLMPPNLPAFRGRDAVRQYWAGLLGLGKADVTIGADDIQQSGDMAVERGHYALTIAPRGGGATISDKGKYVIMWRKRGGEWKAVDDIFNSDLPLPPPR